MAMFNSFVKLPEGIPPKKQHFAYVPVLGVPTKMQLQRIPPKMHAEIDRYEEI